MGRSKLTWEEVSQYERIDNFAGHVWCHNGKYYYVEEEGGIAPQRVVYDLSDDLFHLLESGQKSMSDIHHKLRYGSWLANHSEQDRVKKERAEERPIILISNQDNQKLFTQEELERLIPIAEKQWIDWKGKLPDGYVSPLGDGNGSSDIEWGNQDSEVSDETFIEFLRENPSASLQNPEIAQKLFSPEEFTTLIREAVTVELEPQKIDSMGLVDGHLELLLLDPIGWQEEIEGVHLELLQEKLNNYLYFIESKQYAERYGDQFDKKVINLTFQYSPSDKGLAFLAAAQKTLSPTDIHLKIVLPDE